MKFTKINAGSYRYNKWSIEKLHGAWLVKKGLLHSEHATWFSTLKSAKEYITLMEAK
jgi:hypothetical protein